MHGGDPVAAGNWRHCSAAFPPLCLLGDPCDQLIPSATVSVNIPDHPVRVTGGLRHVLVEFYPCQSFPLLVPVPLFVFGIGGLFTLMMS